DLELAPFTRDPTRNDGSPAGAFNRNVGRGQRERRSEHGHALDARSKLDMRFDQSSAVDAGRNTHRILDGYLDRIGPGTGVGVFTDHLELVSGHPDDCAV